MALFDLTTLLLTRVQSTRQQGGLPHFRHLGQAIRHTHLKWCFQNLRLVSFGESTQNTSCTFRWELANTKTRNWLSAQQS